MTITILYNNIAYDSRLTTAWGFSALVEIPDHTLLFDTGGDAPTLLNNMQILDVETAAIESVVLSHAHGDHTGGLEGLLAVGMQPTVHLLPSFPRDVKDSVRRFTTVAEVESGQSLATEIFTTGEMGTSIPEQALVLRTSMGLVVITGCAHPGIVQIVERAQALFGNPIYLVMGGFHLGDHSAAQIEAIVQSFRRLGVLHVAPSHCTGDQAIEAFRHEYGDDFIEAGAGRVIVIEP
jgi:7,8-dihydropterin-6-yl-methyl-4-(beta-D-ribofuranosyl)aminobenzene 5'-phosphate synthase